MLPSTQFVKILVFIIVFSLDSYMFRHVHRPLSGLLTKEKRELYILLHYVNNVVMLPSTQLVQIMVFIIVFSLDSYMFRHVHRPSSGLLTKEKRELYISLHYVINYSILNTIYTRSRI